MKKIILMIGLSLGLILISIKPIYAYKDGTTFQDYIDFDVSNLNQSPFTHKMPSFWTGSKSLYISINWVGKNLTISLNEQTTLYEQDVILDTHTLTTPLYFYQYSGIAYDIVDDSTGDELRLIISNIMLDYFDESYYDEPSLTTITFSDVPNSYLPAGLNRQSSSFQYQFEMYNYLNEILPYDAYNNGYDYGREIGYGEGYNDAIETLPDEIANAFQNGYDRGKQVYAFFYNGQWLSAKEFGDMQFQLGLEENPTNSPLGVLLGGIAAIFGTGLSFILQLGTIELLGISLNMIVGIGLLLVGLLAILGLIFGGK